MCQHIPRCPSAGAPDATAALVVVAHPDQGWSKLCNGLILFEDLGYLLPEGSAITQAASATARAVSLRPRLAA